ILMKPIEVAPYFTATRDELAHTTAQVVWHAQHANYAVVATILPDYAPWYHLLIELDGEWLVSESSFSNWLPYDTPKLDGVLVDVVQVDEQVRGGRVAYQGQVAESQVNEEYLCTVIWDVAHPTLHDKVNYLELLIGDSWQECIVSWFPTTAQQFANAYLTYHRTEGQASKDKYWWAVQMLFTDDQQEKLKLALAIIDYADLSRDEYALGCLGAGPLEDLMSEWLLDSLENVVSNNSKLKYALSMVRMDFEEENIQQRVARLLK
ncbi:MAG: hypothetical protein KC413_14545, partial [Anaerolineales bacterium]|nr:hypothetical protein [Anaerolineales bacterium]